MSNSDYGKLGIVILAAVVIGALVVDYVQEKKLKKILAEQANETN